MDKMSFSCTLFLLTIKSVHSTAKFPLELNSAIFSIRVLYAPLSGSEEFGNLNSCPPPTILRLKCVANNLGLLEDRATQIYRADNIREWGEDSAPNIHISIRYVHCYTLKNISRDFLFDVSHSNKES